MHFAEFCSDTPLQHVQRALDELGRGGFDLSELCVVTGNADARIRIAFRDGGGVRPETLLARIERMPGVRDMAGGPAEERA